MASREITKRRFRPAVLMDDLKEYEGSMRTDKNGNLYIAGKPAFDQFFKDNPDASFTFKIVRTSPETKKRLIAYFMAEVVPKVTKGYRNIGEILTKQDVIDRLAHVGSARVDMTEDGKTIVKDLFDLNYFELRRHIQEIIIFAAYDLETVIEEPK